MKTIKRLLRYIKPFKKNLIAAVISAFIGILFSLLVPVFIGYGVQCARFCHEIGRTYQEFADNGFVFVHEKNLLNRTDIGIFVEVFFIVGIEIYHVILL